MTLRRSFAGIGAAAFVLVAVVLSLSDRAPGAYGRTREAVWSVSARVRDHAGVDWFSRSDIPFASDHFGHVVLWATGTFLVGLALRSRWSLSRIAVASFAASVALELAQPVVTATRIVEWGDIVANGIGVVLGLAGLAALAVLRPAADARGRPG